ncbi:ABC transporter substrate-binding protein [Herbiconiux sp. 11R-BC]|uniref:ABC transporter substrate-binding protein n=1 Tax=Herbiconiux sp. 11R-BC TaxID=3111637 RepID=UPI003C109C6F
MLHRHRITFAALAATTLIALAGCSTTAAPASSGTAASDSSDRLPEMTKVNLLLDYFVYGAHAGIYEAIQKGYYTDNNIDLNVIVPNDPVASLKFVDAGQADIGIASPLDLISSVSDDTPYDAFMSLVGGNLEGLAVLKSSGITSAAELEGKKVGTSGSVSHDAITRAEIEGAGGDTSAVEFVTVGSGFMQYLANGQVDAVAAFKPDVAAAEAAGEDVEFLPMGSEGGLAFPSIVAYAASSTVQDDSAMIRAFTAATVKGYNDMIADPEAAAQATVDQNVGLELEPMVEQVEGIGDAFIGPNASFGVLDREKLQDLADFMFENNFISHKVDATTFVDTDVVEAG